MNSNQARNVNDFSNQHLSSQAQGQYYQQTGNFITGRGW